MSNYPTCAHGKRLDGICYECTKLFYDARKDAPNHPSTTGSREKALPEKVWLNPHEFFEDDDETAIAFLAHPQQGELLWQSGIRTYYSESALSQARAEARAAGYAEALAKFKHQGTDGCASCYTGRVDYYVTNRKCIQCDPEAYQPARSSAGAEEGEER